MEIYRDLTRLPKFKNAVITIGSFDGVHQGHQKILARLKHWAEKADGQSVVITFHPHPRLFLKSQDPVHLINNLDEKAALLEKYGVDVLVVVPFTAEFANSSPDKYIQEFLVANFNPKYIIIGYDHRFGKNRQGDIEYLRKFEKDYNYTVHEILKQEVDDIAVSSTKIRNALLESDVALAARLLGHPFRISGKVVAGQQLGRSIGYPTANIEVNDNDHLIPPDGVYAVRTILQNKVYKAMLYIGNRPTLDDGLKKSIEVNIFDFKGDIYNEQIQIDFIEHLRSDAKFDNLEELQEQLNQDQIAALEALSSFDS